MADAVAMQELIVGVPYRRITHLRKHLALEFLDAGHILGSASVDLRITEAGSHRLVFSGRHRAERAADHPRPRAALRPGRHADHRVHLRRPEPRVAWPDAEERWARRCGGWPREAGRCWCPRSRWAGCQELVYALHQLWRAGKIPRDPDLRGQPARGRRHDRLPDASRGLRPARAAHRGGEPDLRLPAGPLRARRRGLQGASTPAAGPADHHRGLGHGRVGADPAPPGARHRRPPQPGPLRRFPGRAHARAGGSRRARRGPHPGRGVPASGRGREHRRLLGARRPGASFAPGCGGSAARSGGPSWCTASRPRCRRWPTLLREEGVPRRPRAAGTARRSTSDARAGMPPPAAS